MKTEGASAAGDTLLPAGDVYCAGTWRCDAAAVNGVLRLLSKVYSYMNYILLFYNSENIDRIIELFELNLNHIKQIIIE